MRKYWFVFLFISFLASCKTPPFVQTGINIKEPRFDIVSIAIIQAELINTQFEAVLKIDNPNDFPVEISSIRYELHGNGMFWVDGNEDYLLLIPEKSSCETKFKFTMNFINMNRRILDDVIRMRSVQYRFKGDLEVKLSASKNASFPMAFLILLYRFCVCLNCCFC